MFDGIGDRLGDAEVGGRLDLDRIALQPFAIHHDRNRSIGSAGNECRPQTLGLEQRREDSLGQ